MSGRGDTRAGRPARLPQGPYTPSPAIERPGSSGLVVVFHGEDGRSARFRVDDLPLPGWHEPLAVAWESRIGSAGRLRTLASVRSSWDVLGRFMRFLDAVPQPPADPRALTVAHVEGFLAARRDRLAAANIGTEWRALARIMRLSPLREMIPVPTLEAAARRWTAGRSGRSKPGYSDRELARLLTAARRDVAAVRDRMDAAEQLLTRAPDLMSEEARLFAEIAETGAVPAADVDVAPLSTMRPRRQRAGQLFVIWPDVTPLLVLLVAVTGRNIETIKELPAEHRIIEDRAVELRVTKRRRGAQRWTETVTWEIGPPRRELHTPGGLYLLLHRLCARGRRFSGSERIWSIWRNGRYAHLAGAQEHFDPFSRGLHTHSPYLRDWVAARDLRADAPSEEADGSTARPLSVDFNRLKTSIDVRRTRALGGHLPSAARSNTVLVLFSNYLRDDPTTIDWAHDIIGEAVVDAEQAALDAHRRALAAAGGGPALTTSANPSAGDTAVSGARHRRGDPQEVAWSSCADPQHHPGTGTACRASFLDCFHCGNCLITPAHLPRLLALLEALQIRREQLDRTDWWARYGPAWAAIRHDVLPKFSPAELAHAAAAAPTDALLDLVEAPWEHP